MNTARPVVAGGTGATSASDARTNLGLETMATQAASSVAITGGAIDGTAIGGTTPAAGAFTTLNATGATSVAALEASGVLSVASDIQHVGDTDNKIAFGTDTQSFETGGTSRLDLSDSGVRMGATGARVTDIQTTITDSDTKLPTSGAVVDHVSGIFPFSVHAAIYFNMTSPGTINASTNIASITRNSEGNYTITFSSAAANTNYLVVSSVLNSGILASAVVHELARTTTTLQVLGTTVNAGGYAFTEHTGVSIIVYEL